MASIKDGNILVSNKGLNPLVNFNFMLRVELAFDLPCKRIHAFSRELEYDYIQEGGVNDYVHMRRKPISKPFTLEVERYVGVDYIDPLKLGTELMLPMLLFVSRKQDDFARPYRTYVFTGCSVIKKTFGELVSEQSGLLVETTTIAYREMLCVDTPWNEEDIPTAEAGNLPGNAVSESKKDENGKNLKTAAMDYFLRAQEADTQAMAYSPEEAEAFKAELNAAIDELKDALKGSGFLTKSLDEAKRGMESGGTPLKELARDARGDANSKERAMKEVEPPFRSAEDAWKQAKDEVDQAQSAAQNTRKEQEALQQEQDQLLERMVTLETELEQADALEIAAEKSLAEAQQALATMKDLGAAEQTTLNEQLKEARAQLEQLDDTASETDRKTAQERVSGFEADLSRAEERQKRRLSEGEERVTAAEQEKKRAAEARTALENEQKQRDERAEALQEEIEQARTAAEDAAKEAEQKQTTLEEAEEALKEPKAAYEEAEKAFAQADAAAEEKEREAAQAEAALARAQDAYDRGNRILQSLQNSLNNLPSRMDTAQKAQEDCHEQFTLCQEENDRVQDLPDDPTPPINQGYETVKKYAKETMFQQRIVRATQQHIEAARALLKQIPSPEEEEEN